MPPSFKRTCSPVLLFLLIANLCIILIVRNGGGYTPDAALAEKLNQVGELAHLNVLKEAWSGVETGSPIHIVLTASGTYVTGLLGLVNSTLSTASPSTLQRLQFHLISSSETDAERIIRLVKGRFPAVNGKIIGYGLEEVGDKRVEGVTVWAGYRAASLSQPIVYARYLIPSLLPETVSRVIYLDQDVLVLKDIALLWDVDLEGYAIGAARLCRDSALWRKQFKMGKEALKNSNFDHDTCTLNNGVLLYDLDQWRAHDANPPDGEAGWADQLFNWTRMNSEDQLYNLGSQPPFNLVFYRNYKVLDDRFNLMDISGLHESAWHATYRPELPWTRPREEVDQAVVIHWNGVFKPWSCDGEGYYSELWTQYFPDFRHFLPPPEPGQDKLCQEMVVTDLVEAPSVEQFTVVIVSFARVDNLMKIARHLQKSMYLKEILIPWNNLEVPCPAEVAELPWVTCIPQEANLVHNRFLVWSRVQTDAVLHYDDDLMAPIEDLEAGFHIWRRHRDQVVGFEPRVIVCDGDEEAREAAKAAEERGEIAVQQTGLLPTVGKIQIPNGCKYKFKLAKTNYFDVVIGKLFFVNKAHMRSYFDNDFLVNLSNEAPCEDIAMSFLAGDRGLDGGMRIMGGSKPPILVKSNLTEIHSKLFDGLSQGIASGVWRAKRGDCVQELMNIFDGRRPGPQYSYYELDTVRRRVYKMQIAGNLDDGWCSDTAGSRVCRQP